MQQPIRDVPVMVDDGFLTDPVQGGHLRLFPSKALEKEQAEDDMLVFCGIDLAPQGIGGLPKRVGVL
jgi:hypothetical protein